MSSAYPLFGPVCQRCGRPLRPNEVQCSNCGFLNAQPHINTPTTPPPVGGASWGNGIPQAPFGSGQYGGQQWGQQPFQGQPAPNNLFSEQPHPQMSFGTQNLFGPQAPVQPQSSVSPTSFASPQQPFSSQPQSQPLSGGLQAGRANPFPGAGTSQSPARPLSGDLSQSPGRTYPQHGSNSFQQPPAGFPPTVTQTFNGGFQSGYQPGSMNGFSSGNLPGGQRPGQKRGKRTRLIVGVIALVVILIAVSVGGYVFFSKPSSTAIVPPPSYTPAPTPVENPLFSDQFVNNNHGWDLSSSSGQFSVKVGNGSMVLEDDNNRLLWEIVPGGKNFSNFYLTLDAVLSKGSQDNGYGIYIRGSSNQSLDIATYYRFEMYGDGTYAIFKGTVDASGTSNSVKLVDYTTSSIINKQGQVNHIAINANGSTMSFYVNGHLIKFVTDNTYPSGSIAMFVSNLPNSPPGAQATFSHLVIYPAQP